jgi:hypothetical protein
MSQKVTTGVRPTLRIADKNQIPATEPERQYYFMDIAKEYLFVKKRRSSFFNSKKTLFLHELIVINLR